MPFRSHMTGAELRQRFLDYFARTKEELYPDRPDLCRDHSHQLKSGWWVGLNYSKEAIKGILSIACEVAGLRFGSDLRVNLG